MTAAVRQKVNDAEPKYIFIYEIEFQLFEKSKITVVLALNALGTNQCIGSTTTPLVHRLQLLHDCSLRL